MLSQGDQLLQQLKRFDELKAANKAGSEPPQAAAHPQTQQEPAQGADDTAETHGEDDIEEGDGETPALGQYRPSELIRDTSLAQSQQEQFTSLKILHRKPKYVPPINFALVEEGIYRSGHPQPINYQYMRDLKIKTIIYIGDKEDNYEYYKFIQQEKINFKYLKLETSTAPLMYKNPECLTEALNVIVNVENYPILIHSNKGKHRIGILVGLMRKFLQGWCLSGIFDEYDKFAGGKGDIDLEFIEMFECELTIDDVRKPGFVKV